MKIMEAAAAAAASPALLGASMPSSTVFLQVLLLMLMLVYLVQPHMSCRKSTCTTAPLPPGPTPWPIVGNLPEMLLSDDKPAFRWIHLAMKAMGTDIACVKLGGVHVIPITCPAIAREVLKEQDANFACRPLTFASKTFSRGYMDAVMCPYGNQWRKMRRVLASEVVCPSRHRWLHDKRAGEADNLTRYVYNLAVAGGGGAVDVRHVARHYCGNVVRRLVFNRRYFGEPRPDGSPGPLEVQHVDSVFTSLRLLYSFSVSDYLPCLLCLDLDGHKRMVKEAHETVSRLHDTLVDERWRQWKSGERRELVEDLLDVLISLKDAEGKPLLTVEEVRALVQDITFAAMDNPSNAVEWALAEMVNAPETMRKAVEELDGVVGRGRMVEESDIPRLKYLKACICEAFRLHPVAPFNVPHVALADATVAGYHVPKDSHVILSRVGLGRNPAVWNDPLRFDPDRHLAADDPEADVTLAENDLRFISFSTGRRGCIAASLGTAMSVMLFGRLLQGFSWSKPAGMAAIDLSESRHDLFMAKPLVLHAEPRLPAHLYSALSM